MKEEEATKYLGDFITVSLEESIHETVTKRIGLARHSIYELRNIIEDTRAEKIGGINLAFEIFDSSIVSSLLLNCETWYHIQKKTIRVINSFISSFYNCIFRIGSGSPIANYYWQVASLLPVNIILQRQILFYFHLSCLPPGSLGRDFIDVQWEKSIEGLVSVTKEHVNKIGKNPLFVSK